MPKKLFFSLPEEKQERILKAATEEFIEYKDNYSKASVKRIAKNADIAIGSIYQYFEDKEDILSYLINRYFEMPRLEEEKDSLFHLAKSNALYYINSSDEHKMLIDILTNNVRTAFFPFIFKYPPKEFYETVYRLLERDQKKGLLTEGINIRQAAYLFLAMDFIAACYKEIEGDADTPLLDLSYQFSKLFFHGIYEQADGWDELGTGYF